MLPIILDKRQSRVKSGHTFNKLIKYVEGNIGDEQQVICLNQNFEDILNYTTDRHDKLNSQEKCIAIRTHGVTDISSAAIEMNAVSARNTRCKDPAFHFVLTWPEHERPKSGKIFDAAEHAIKSLGLADHQYILAIHVNTDNIHCHGAVNRIHPDTYKSRNIEWANKTIHLAARQSEIKHGWMNDNGIYIVRTDSQNKKKIVLNPDHDRTIPQALRDFKPESDLPTWHDPDSIDSWLKSKVAKALKHALPTLTSWHALHVWLANQDITLSDSGGGGMQLHVTSQETGEFVDLSASKGLRILKRSDLEIRWGKFTNKQPIDIAPDLSHLNHSEITNGVNLFKANFDDGIPPAQIISTNKIKHSASTIKEAEIIVDKADSLRSLSRDNTQRTERSKQRAAARADLRHRFSQYQRFVREGDVDYLKHKKDINSERSRLLKAIRDETKAEILAVRNVSPVDMAMRFHRVVEIEFERSRRKLKTEALTNEKNAKLRATRLPPLGWREWLHEQSNLGDQAAISALRGIVYQAQRDVKRENDCTADPIKSEADTKEYREQQFKKVISRLLEQEKQEVAIRSARSDAMRPYEVDSLFAQYVGVQWHVTGNGNIEYSQNGDHLFTDRGNRITFDRVRVSDEEICLALIHARQKFGNQLTLTGNDPDFTKRMACLADDMGMTVLNPDLQLMVANHQAARELLITPASQVPTPHEIAMFNESIIKPAQTKPSLQESTEPSEEIQPESLAPAQPPAQAIQDYLRIKVLAIDPCAKFVIPEAANSHVLYAGPVAASLDDMIGFAQHIGRGVFALHPTLAPENHNNVSIEVHYQNGQAITTVPNLQKKKGRTD
jgi:hypothetical protein